jgi:hypothetical protein
MNTIHTSEVKEIGDIAQLPILEWGDRVRIKGLTHKYLDVNNATWSYRGKINSTQTEFVAAYAPGIIISLLIAQHHDLKPTYNFNTTDYFNDNTPDYEYLSREAAISKNALALVMAASMQAHYNNQKLEVRKDR